MMTERKTDTHNGRRVVLLIGERGLTDQYRLCIHPTPLGSGTPLLGNQGEARDLDMRTEIDEPAIPSGIAILGSDDATGEYLVLSVDEREVSRTYDVDVRPDGLTWRRNAPGFSQRMDLTMSPDGDAIVSRGEFSRDGATWEGDLELTYRRIREMRAITYKPSRATR